MKPITIYLFLSGISILLAAIPFIFENQKNFFKVTLALIPPVLGLFFTSSEDISFRLISTFLTLFSYVFFSWIFKTIHKFIIDRDNMHSDIKSNSINLPLNYNFNIDNSFLESIPDCVMSINNISNGLKEITDDFISGFNSVGSDSEKADLFKSYFLGICYNVRSTFSFETRVHIRILNGIKYIKYVAVNIAESNREYKLDLTPMSLDNKMIDRSYTENCSLIHSFNPDLHENGKNRRWKNYLTFTFPQFIHEDKPVFSFGISINRKHNNYFYFLNFCQIENIIGSYIDRVIEECADIRDFVERYYFN